MSTLEHELQLIRAAMIDTPLYQAPATKAERSHHTVSCHLQGAISEIDELIAIANGPNRQILQAELRMVGTLLTRAQLLASFLEERRMRVVR